MRAGISWCGAQGLYEGFMQAREDASNKNNSEPAPSPHVCLAGPIKTWASYIATSTLMGL